MWRQEPWVGYFAVLQKATDEKDILLQEALEEVAGEHKPLGAVEEVRDLLKIKITSLQGIVE